MTLSATYEDLFGLIFLERSYYLRIMCNLTHDSTQLEEFDTIPTLWQSLKSSWSLDPFGYGEVIDSLIAARDTLNQKVLDQTIKTFEFFDHSISLTSDFTLLWQEVCRSTNTDVQKFITSDVYRSRAIAAFSTERDITLFILHNGSFVYNETEFQYLQNNYFGSQKINSFFWELSQLFFTGTQFQYYSDLNSDPEYISASSEINQTRLMIDSYFIAGTMFDPAQAEAYLDASDIYIELLDAGDAEEVSPDQRDVNIKFGISVVGTIVEMIAAINLLWLGLPIILLLWRLNYGHSTPSQASSSPPL
eukprot:TRINITY_DN3005_c0_g1_i2.p1 TRINITY_DN3005_c0_g1~~TRINITY_DN3005_c0_g1_i2.p1  ORF type:complete len:305 (+),score=23.99 TRINITY_DN3005_c0_g1_i2:203-1117(+)